MRLGGILLYLLFLTLAPVAYLLLPVMILINPVRAKESMRAVDQLCNAFFTNGLGRESLSSHSYRYQGAWWADFVVWLTDKIQDGHCREANRIEQPIVDFINTH